MPAEEFIDLYKTLEQVLRVKYEQGPDDKNGYENLIIRYASSNEGTPYRKELDSIREIRNLLQHLPMENGQYLVEPSPEITQKLKKIINSIQNPQKAMDFSIPASKIFTTSLNENAYSVMKVMYKKGHSHVPVIQDGKIIGVFSTGTIFSFMMVEGISALSATTNIADFKKYLPIDAHKNERYEFVSKETTFTDVKIMFENSFKRPKRLVALFITETGLMDEKLMGMVTPWDILGHSGEN